MTTKQSIEKEIKCEMKDFIKNMNTETIGRPLWIFVIGENGWNVLNTKYNTFTTKDNAEIITGTLAEIIKAYNEEFKE